MKQWVCNVCGYIHETEDDVTELPEDFVCPICGAGRDEFSVM